VFTLTISGDRVPAEHTETGNKRARVDDGNNVPTSDTFNGDNGHGSPFFAGGMPPYPLPGFFHPYLAGPYPFNPVLMQPPLQMQNNQLKSEDETNEEPVSRETKENSPRKNGRNGEDEGNAIENDTTGGLTSNVKGAAPSTAIPNSPAGLQSAGPPTFQPHQPVMFPSHAMMIIPSMQPLMGMSPNFHHNHQQQTRGIPLALQCDVEHLSDYQILVRQQLELFEAGPADVESNTQGRKRQVVQGQVGLRCRHCTALPLRARGRGAVYYPTKLSGVYQAAQNMATSHLIQACPTIPPALKRDLQKLREQRSNASGGKKYWADSTKAHSVVETEHGLQFDRGTNGNES